MYLNFDYIYIYVNIYKYFYAIYQVFGDTYFIPTAFDCHIFINIKLFKYYEHYAYCDTIYCSTNAFNK